MHVGEQVGKKYATVRILKHERCISPATGSGKSLYLCHCLPYQHAKMGASIQSGASQPVNLCGSVDGQHPKRHERI